MKNMGTDGWVLFNIQTLQLIKAQPAASKKQTISYGDIKKSDVFSTLMAGLVNDSAVLYTSIAKADPVKESSKTSIPDTQPRPNEITRTDPVPKNDSITRVVETVRQETPQRQTVLRVSNRKLFRRKKFQRKIQRLLIKSCHKRNKRPVV